MKKFNLIVAVTEDSDYAVIKCEGRDVFDAYRKACNRYDIVLKPYTSRPSTSKYCKKQSIRKQRRNGWENKHCKLLTNGYFFRSKGVVWID